MSKEVKEVGVASYMPATQGFTMACFKAEDVAEGCKLYIEDTAAANKAAEEGELPPTLNDLARLFADAYQNRKEVTLSSESCEKLFLAMTTSAETDRASRQVANKAEVEQSDAQYAALSAAWPYIEGIPHIVELFGSAIPSCYGIRRATPPATTGASTARDQALEDAAEAIDAMNDASGDAAAYDNREQNLFELEREHAISACAEKVRSLKGSVGASTVLTDERIEWILRDLGVKAADRGEPMTSIAFARAIEREVAAQAGQVAEKDRLLKALERAAIAESALRRLADEVENDAVPGWEDRLMACIAEANSILNGSGAGQVAVPEALAILSDLTRPYGVFDVALNNCHKDNVEDFYALLARVRALTPSPAKESK